MLSESALLPGRRTREAARAVPERRLSGLAREMTRIRESGGGGIRTLERLSTLADFKSAAIGHSATPPYRRNDSWGVILRRPTRHSRSRYSLPSPVRMYSQS